MGLLYYISFIVYVTSIKASHLDEWQQFKLTYNKSYTSLREENLRYKIFAYNSKIINEHNKMYEKGLVTFTKELNKFGDMTTSEFYNYLKLCGFHKNLNNSELYIPLTSAPSKIDWRDYGAVTHVKNQGNCGSCWSFSATGSLEGQNKIINRKLVSLSEQNLMDCSSSYGNIGCKGGLMDYAFAYVRDHGINSEEDYPYQGAEEKCKFSPNKFVLKTKGYIEIEEDAENDLLSAVGNIGPISVAIDATSELQFYASGVFTDDTCSKLNLNHGVLAVGYGSGKDGDYWIIKNSWGASWGESGYVKFKRGVNMCGVAAMGSFPKL